MTADLDVPAPSTNSDSSSSPPPSAASTLRARLADPNAPILVCPGVYDGLSARLVLSAGFEGLYMTGAGTTASLLGQPDLGLLTLPEMRTHAENLASISPTTPLIADADTGFGSPLNISRTVQSYARSGVAALHIEDQVLAKRCGHLGGKQLADEATWRARIRAAVQARRAAGAAIVIIARTDALRSGEGGEEGWKEAVRRLRVAREEGADAGFCEGVRSVADARRAVREMEGWPMVLNMVYGGLTPPISVAEAGEMGYRVVIFPFACLSPALQAVRGALRTLKETGECGEEGRMGPREVFEVVGLRDALRVDSEAGGVAYEEGV